MNTSSRLVHALSFDIEDWFHMVGIPASADPATWPSFPSIVERYTDQILGLLQEFDVRATFFILGWIGERYPSLIRRIADGGHEIGTHSFWHRKVYELTPDEFRKDLLDSIAVLEQHPGIKVRGFRAPSFSIIPGSEWAFGVISQSRLLYDASLFPARRAHGGYPCHAEPHRIEPPDALPIAELPVSIHRWGPIQYCCTGGGYFRLLPLWVIERAVRNAEQAGRPVVVYLHPRDFATDCPVMSMPIHRRFKSYVGRSTTETKLRQLLKNHRFTTCREVLQQCSLLPAEPVLARKT